MIGTKLAGRYEILGELGRGGMGVVYRAHDPLLDREVAVKVVPPSLLTPDAELRFQREAQVVARMDHPSIVTVYDIGRHEGALFFVMPIVRGTTLRALLRERALRLGDVVEIGLQVAEALDYSHALGVVHRDIKPENLMVRLADPEGARVRIMDFGLARASLESQLTRITRSGTLVGTVSYFSPEQVAGYAEVDARSDVYSLGTVLYECMLGEPPFTGEVQSVLYRIVHEIPQPPTARGAEVDAELEAVAMRCLARDPAGRYQTAREVVDALARYRSGLVSEDRRRPIAHASTRLARPELVSRDVVPLVGRERELAELQHRLNAAVAGECQFVVVSGDAGMGKSRLLEELERLARARRIPVLHGRFVEQDRSFPYQAFCEALQEYFRSRDSASGSSEVVDFSDLAPELAELFPVLAEIGDIRAASADSRSGERRAPRHVAEDRTAVFELLARAVGRAAAGRPLVLLLEDLHDADVSVEALQYVVRRLGPAPILFVGTYRSSEVDRRHVISRLLDGFHGDRRFAHLQLGPLAPAEHRAFVEALGGARPAGALAAALYEATEGNPFFTRELVRSLADSGAIVADEGGALSLSSEIGLAGDALPDTIQQVVERRVERLSEGEREVLSAASVLGRTFEYRDLAALADDRHDVEEAVDRLLRQGLLDEERESRGDRLSFASGVVRDAIYAGLPRRRRRALHRRHAEWLERRNAGKERYWAALAHHYSHGDVAAKAVEYGLKAARRSLEAFGAEEAIRAARLALEFLEDEEVEAERREEGEARMLLVSAYRMEGNIDAALREAERAAKVFEREGDDGRALEALVVAAETAWQGRRIEETRRWVERGTEAGRGAPHAETLARLLSLGATVANLRGEYEAAREYLDEVERLRPSGAARGEEVPRGGTLVVALAGPVASLEPATLRTIEEEEIAANVFERLFTTDERGHLAPLLCERWEALDGGRALLLTLRADARFSDGSPLTAGDVKRSFERAVRLDRDAPRAAVMTVRGASEFASGAAEEIEGLVVRSDSQLEVRLVEPLPVYPALLSDVGTAVARVASREDGSEVLLGTGPFRVASRSADRVTLEPNPEHRGEPPRLDRIEFRLGLGAAEVAAEFEAGRVDVAREMAPDDLERLLRDPRLRATLAEAPRRSACFAVFNASSPAMRRPDLRRALAGIVRPEDLVWRTLGRLALPAAGVIPPGMLGHDPGRRSRPIGRERALELIEASGAGRPVRLRAAASPPLLDRYGALVRGLFEVWAQLGVEVSVETPTAGAYLEALHDSSGFDMLLCRWNADYDDPDNFTHGLFHSRTGLLREYFGSPEADRIAEEARAEPDAAAREAIYRRFETSLLESGMVVPLLHEVNYRLVRRCVRGLRVQGVAPYVNYDEVGKAEPAAARRRARGGILHAPGGLSSFDTLDPTRISTLSQGEVVPNVFETLTRVVDGATVVPWLAEEFAAEEGGRRFRFRLRDDVRFHDGRRLTARDVRYSFERFLLDSQCAGRGLLAPIRGARRMIAGEAGDLEGFRILSSREFTLELESPLELFAVMLTNAATAIVPEGSGGLEGDRRAPGVGTGPFRVVRFEPGLRLELERNRDYWREGYPRSEGLVFTFGLTSEETADAFRAGRLSLASDLAPGDVDALRHDPRYAAGYREMPRLSTAFVALNAARGPLADPALRRLLVRSVDTAAVVRRVLGRFTMPAHGLIPPGLLGYEAGSAIAGPISKPSPPAEPVELTGVAHPAFAGRYAALTRELLDAFRRAGFAVRLEAVPLPRLLEAMRAGSADLVFNTWVADYPDADSFARGLVHTADGELGSMCGSAEVDELVERARLEAEPATRHFLYRRLEEAVARDALLLPLFHPRNYVFARPEVEGLTITSYTYPSVAYESLWIK